MSWASAAMPSVSHWKPLSRSEWKPLIPLLRQQLPELLCLGDCDPEHRQGPVALAALPCGPEPCRS
jgi:hypothetical protein